MDLENNLGKLPQLVGVERICYFLLLRALQLNRRSNGGPEDAGQVYAEEQVHEGGRYSSSRTPTFIQQPQLQVNGPDLKTKVQSARQQNAAQNGLQLRMLSLLDYVDLETLYERYGFKSSFGPAWLQSKSLGDAPVLMIFLGTEKMTGNPEAFRQGASALRNARNLVKEKRDELTAAANGKALNAEQE